MLNIIGETLVFIFGIIGFFLWLSIVSGSFRRSGNISLGNNYNKNKNENENENNKVIYYLPKMESNLMKNAKRVMNDK